MDKTRVYSVVYTCINADDFQNPHITVKSFLSRETAEDYIKKDYESALKFETADSSFDIIDCENYGHLAYIKMGIGGNDVNSEVESMLLWRIHSDVV